MLRYPGSSYNRKLLLPNKWRLKKKKLRYWNTRGDEEQRRVQWELWSCRELVLAQDGAWKEGGNQKKTTLNLYPHPLIFKDWPNQMINPPVRKLRRHSPQGSSSHGTKQGQEKWRMNQQVGREGQNITSSEGLLDWGFEVEECLQHLIKDIPFAWWSAQGGHHFFPGD